MCGICLELLASRGRQWLQCSHASHEACILEMRRFGIAGVCPTCRRACSNLMPVHELIFEAVWHDMSMRWADACRCASEALDIAHEDAEKTEAMHRLLGIRFLEGKGVDQNVGKAVEHFEKARERGDAY